MTTGDLLAGRFRIERAAGAGGMGVVYQALDLATNEPVALKLLAAGSRGDAARFEMEAQTLSELAHPGIVRYLTHGVAEGGQLYLAMEWLSGESLEDRLGRAGLTLA